MESYDKGVFLDVFSIIWRSLRTGKLHINNYYCEERRSAWCILRSGLWAQNNSALLETWIRCNASYYETSLQLFHYRSPHRSQKQKGNNNADGFWGIKKVPLTLCLQCSFTPGHNFFEYLLAHSWIENQPVNKTEKPSSQVSKPSAIFLQHLTKAASWQCGYSGLNASPQEQISQANSSSPYIVLFTQ